MYNTRNIRENTLNIQVYLLADQKLFRCKYEYKNEEVKYLVLVLAELV